jgi:hypothetical protein
MRAPLCHSFLTILAVLTQRCLRDAMQWLLRTSVSLSLDSNCRVGGLGARSREVKPLLKEVDASTCKALPFQLGFDVKLSE